MSEEIYHLFLALGSGDDSDSHAENVLQFFVSRFWEDSVFLDTESVVPHLVW